MKPKAVFLIDSITPKNAGRIAFILFAIAVIIMILSMAFFEWYITWVLLVMFILGGFFGRAFERRTTENKK